MNELDKFQPNSFNFPIKVGYPNLVMEFANSEKERLERIKNLEFTIKSLGDKKNTLQEKISAAFKLSRVLIDIENQVYNIQETHKKFNS